MIEMGRVAEFALRSAWRLFSVIWRVTGLVLFASLAILEPVVRFCLSALATVGLLMTLVFGLGNMPHFPTLFMFSMSVGCFLLLALYYWIMGCFGELRDGNRYP